MKLLIDDANIEKIKEIYQYYLVDGVTTNPSILSKQDQSPKNILGEIRKIIGQDELHVQVFSKNSKDFSTDKLVSSEILVSAIFIAKTSGFSLSPWQV